MATGFDLQGLGRVLAALAAAFFLRSIAGPGPAIGPAAEEESPEDDASAGGGEGDEEAPASGGVPPVAIRWSGITCALSDKKGKTVRFLLKNVTGEATPGRLLALMGPSGSGKTTLLNVLAGQLTFSPRLHLSGQLTVNGRPMSQQWFKSAYLRQEDLFFSQLTVCETLSLAAELQLPNSMSAEKRDEYVNELLFRMGLVSISLKIRTSDTKYHAGSYMFWVFFYMNLSLAQILTYINLNSRNWKRTKVEKNEHGSNQIQSNSKNLNKLAHQIPYLSVWFCLMIMRIISNLEMKSWVH